MFVNVAREQLTLRLDGRRIAVEQLRVEPGDRERPVLVFLHEGLGCIEMWRGFPERVVRATGLDAIVYDRLGHGRSDPAPGPRRVRYLHDEAEEVLPQVLDALGVERTILIGHSDGGTIALLHAAAFPQRTVAVVTEAAHVFVEDLTVAGIQEAVEQWRQGELPRRLARYHADNTRELFSNWAEIWLSPEFRSWSVTEALPRVTCRSLVLQGEADQYGTPEQVHTIARLTTGPAEWRLVPGGHTPHLQAPETVLELMTAFLREVASSIDRGESGR